jgi:hypothetical protein
MRDKLAAKTNFLIIMNFNLDPTVHATTTFRIVRSNRPGVSIPSNTQVVNRIVMLTDSGRVWSSRDPTVFYDFYNFFIPSQEL